jgi:hypothetical protein
VAFLGVVEGIGIAVLLSMLLLVYRWDARFFFANAEIFRERVLATLERFWATVSSAVGAYRARHADG